MHLGARAVEEVLGDEDGVLDEQVVDDGLSSSLAVLGKGEQDLIPVVCRASVEFVFFIFYLNFACCQTDRSCLSLPELLFDSESHVEEKAQCEIHIRRTHLLGLVALQQLNNNVML